MGCPNLTYRENPTPLKVVYNAVKTNKKGCAGLYRYGFQGQEQDNEIKGNGNSVNFKYRMHDTRLGRFFAVDPLTSKYPHNSPYSFSENKVIQFIELEGLEVFLSKAQRAEYGGGFSNIFTFGYNSGVSLYNGFVSAFNYAGELDEIDKQQGTVFSKRSFEKVEKDALNTVTTIHNYLANTTPQQFVSDLKDAFSNVETYEDIAGGLFVGGGLKILKGPKSAVAGIGIAETKSIKDGFGSLLNNSKFDRFLNSKGKGIQFKNSGNASESFKELYKSFGLDESNLVKSDGATMFTHENRTFTLRSDSKGTNTISAKTNNNPQQILVRFENE